MHDIQTIAVGTMSIYINRSAVGARSQKNLLKIGYSLLETTKIVQLWVRDGKLTHSTLDGFKLSKASVDGVDSDT